MSQLLAVKLQLRSRDPGVSEFLGVKLPVGVVRLGAEPEPWVLS